MGCVMRDPHKQRDSSDVTTSSDCKALDCKFVQANFGVNLWRQSFMAPCRSRSHNDDIWPMAWSYIYQRHLTTAEGTMSSLNHLKHFNLHCKHYRAHFILSNCHLFAISYFLVSGSQHYNLQESSSSVQTLTLSQTWTRCQGHQSRLLTLSQTFCTKLQLRTRCTAVSCTWLQRA